MGSLSDIVSSSIGGGATDPSVQTDQTPVPINTYDAIFGTAGAVQQAQQDTMQQQQPQVETSEMQDTPGQSFGMPVMLGDADRHPMIGNATTPQEFGYPAQSDADLAARREDAGVVVDRNSKDNYFGAPGTGTGDRSATGSDTKKGAEAPMGVAPPASGKRSPALERMMRDSESNIKAGMARRRKERGMI